MFSLEADMHNISFCSNFHLVRLVQLVAYSFIYLIIKQLHKLDLCWSALKVVNEI
jgi:hypothetical protein